MFYGINHVFHYFLCVLFEFCVFWRNFVNYFSRLRRELLCGMFVALNWIIVQLI